MAKAGSVSAFILTRKQLIPHSPKPSSTDFYDENTQIWMCLEEGVPIVSKSKKKSNQIHASNFGETSINETKCGTDQSEVTADHVLCSDYGETTITKTSEGTDQHESTSEFEIRASEYGETLITDTFEGSDQSESIFAINNSKIEASDFGETTITRTNEGVDQPEILKV